MAKQSKILKSALRQAIKATGGNVSMMAGDDYFNCSRQTIYNRIRECDLQGELKHWREMIHTMAEGNVFDAVAEGDLEQSQFVLKFYPGGPRWNSRHEVDVKSVNVSAETLRRLEELGVSIEDVGAAFERMIQEEHARTLIDG